METAIKKLEVLLLKTENDVDRLSNKLDEEFIALSNANEVKSELKLSELLKNTRAIKAELKRVALGVEEFQKNQQEVVAEVKERLAIVSDGFEDLGPVNYAAHNCENS